MFTVDVSFQPLPQQTIREDLNDYVNEYQKLYAKRIVSLLRRRGSSLWPVRTGRSIIGFLYQIVNGVIHIGNRQRYAVFVNNARRTRGGNPNRNYRAIQRTIQRNQDMIARDSDRL